MEHSSSCEHETLKRDCVEDTEKRQRLQSSIDDLLAGKVSRRVPRANRDIFAPFDSDDKNRSSALAGYWRKIAEGKGGLEGLSLAINHMYESLENDAYPIGMVEYAAKVFLTHSPLARQHVVMRSLEERQPGMVKTSQQSTLASTAPTVSRYG